MKIAAPTLEEIERYGVRELTHDDLIEREIDRRERLKLKRGRKSVIEPIGSHVIARVEFREHRPVVVITRDHPSIPGAAAVIVHTMKGIGFSPEGPIHALQIESAVAVPWRSLS